LHFLRRLVVPAVLERVALCGVAHCPRLEEVIFGDAPLQVIEMNAFNGDFRLERLALSATLKWVGCAFQETSISDLDAGECSPLEAFAVNAVLSFLGLVLPSRFSGVLDVYCGSIGRATFGSIKLNASNKFVLVFGEVRFTMLAPPRGDFKAKMFADAFAFGELSRLLGREMAVARPP
jgi:hypothetical protein